MYRHVPSWRDPWRIILHHQDYRRTAFLARQAHATTRQRSIIPPSLLSPVRTGRPLITSPPPSASLTSFTKRHFSVCLSRNPQTLRLAAPPPPTTTGRRTYIFLPTSWTEFKLRLRPRPGRATVLRVMLQRTTQQWKQRVSSSHGAWRRRWTRMRRRAQHQRQRRLLWFQSRVQEFWRKRRAKAKQIWWRTTTTLRRNIRHVQLRDHVNLDWFDTHGRPHVARDETGRFINPWSSQSADGVKSLGVLWTWRVQRFQRELEQYGWWQFWIPTFFQSVTSSSNNQTAAAAVTGTTTTRRHFPWHDEITPSSSSLSSSMRLSWIGHSTCLVQQNGTTLLTDPIFSGRASPFPQTPIGIARSRPPACTVDDLPSHIDVCLISHDHYDHLDKPSVQNLRDRVGLWLVPLGTKEWMTGTAGVDPNRVVEMAWWESLLLKKRDPESGATSRARYTEVENDNNDETTLFEVVQRHALRDAPNDAHPARDRPPTDQELWISCLPVQHWCSRTIWDRNYRLWASYAVLYPNEQTFYFTGDTAWPSAGFPLFAMIRSYLPWPVSLAAIPIGAYNPAVLNADSHVSPPEAVKIHQALRPRQSVAIHHGSFPLSEEPLDEPAQWLVQAAEEAGLNPHEFVAVPHVAAVGDSQSNGGDISSTSHGNSWLTANANNDAAIA